MFDFYWVGYSPIFVSFCQISPKSVHLRVRYRLCLFGVRWLRIVPLHSVYSNCLYFIRSSKTTVRPCVCPPSVLRVCVRNEFYIWLALPISPSIMDRFWCSRCLNDRVEVLYMIRLFAGGATTPLVVKIWTKQP